MESFKATFSQELPIELDAGYPTHIPVGAMLEMVFQASKKAGMDSMRVLRHFRFTEAEIEDFFENLGRRN